MPKVAEHPEKNGNKAGSERTAMNLLCSALLLFFSGCSATDSNHSAGPSNRAIFRHLSSSDSTSLRKTDQPADRKRKKRKDYAAKRD